tara:strand:+ start:1084 stop:1386 length:303 start_codon:yes stop_codon:yes gene_type:complete
MIITNTWTIATCEHDVATGGITVAHWRCNATDGDFGASAYGTCGFAPDAASPDFKAYAGVTEAEVLAWVHESVDKEVTEASLADKINLLANPTSTSGTPW